MAKEEPTRAELTEQLSAERLEKSKLEERLARLEAAFASQTAPIFSEIDLARLKAAKEELESLRPGAGRQLAAPSGPAPRLIPYEGLVRAIEKCAYDHLYEPGEVFYVSVEALWTDDPYEPVRQVNTNDLEPRYERRTDVSQIDFRFRRVIVAAEDPTPRRAAVM